MDSNDSGHHDGENHETFVHDLIFSHRCVDLYLILWLLYQWSSLKPSLLYYVGINYLLVNYKFETLSFLKPIWIKSIVQKYLAIKKDWLE